MAEKKKFWFQKGELNFWIQAADKNGRVVDDPSYFADLTIHCGTTLDNVIDQLEILIMTLKKIRESEHEPFLGM